MADGTPQLEFIGRYCEVKGFPELGECVLRFPRQVPDRAICMDCNCIPKRIYYLMCYRHGHCLDCRADCNGFYCLECPMTTQTSQELRWFRSVYSDAGMLLEVLCDVCDKELLLGQLEHHQNECQRPPDLSKRGPMEKKSVPSVSLNAPAPPSLMGPQVAFMKTHEDMCEKNPVNVKRESAPSVSKLGEMSKQEEARNENAKLVKRIQELENRQLEADQYRIDLEDDVKVYRTVLQNLEDKVDRISREAVTRRRVEMLNERVETYLGPLERLLDGLRHADKE